MVDAVQLPSECYQMQQIIGHYLPRLRRSQLQGLTLWVYGSVMARSSCQNAVATALMVFGNYGSLCQYLREWLYDGADRASPCGVQLDVRACFGPLLRWLLSWWQSERLALAIDPTLKGDKITAIVISVVYRSCAIPIAWHILPANKRGSWMEPTMELIDLLGPAVPSDMTVIVMCDRGLRSQRLYARICAVGWHPYVRQTINTTFCPDGGTRIGARYLVPAPGYAWIGRGTAFRRSCIRRRGTLIVLWESGQEAPCVVLTDLAPEDVGVCWYGLRFWIEAGFGRSKAWAGSGRRRAGRTLRACRGTGWYSLWQRCWYWRMEAEWRTRLSVGYARSSQSAAQVAVA